MHLKRGSLLRFPTAGANLWDQAKANTDVEFIHRLFALKSADPLGLLLAPHSRCAPGKLNIARGAGSPLEQELGKCAPFQVYQIRTDVG